MIKHPNLLMVLKLPSHSNLGLDNDGPSFARCNGNQGPQHFLGILCAISPDKSILKGAKKIKYIYIKVK